jgi:hypothetical protein
MIGLDRVPVVAPLSRSDIENQALRFLRNHSPECLARPRPTPMVRIFDQVLFRHYDFRPVIELLPAGYEGLTHPAGRTVTLAAQVYESLEQDAGRSRFTAAHETGHVVLHAHQLAGFDCQLVEKVGVEFARRSQIKPYLDPEWQANAFAAGLLLPALMVRQVVEGVDFDERVAALREAFDVTTTAAGLRLRTLGLL